MKNNGLSKLEKEILYAAMDEVLSDTVWGTHACTAIRDVGGDASLGLIEKMADFYEQYPGCSWTHGDKEFIIDSPLGREWRLIFMAWFAEVGPKGIE